MATQSQCIGGAVIKARSNLRWQKARDISDAGGSKADALRATGLTLKGLNTLLLKRVGSQRWPIKEKST